MSSDWWSAGQRWLEQEASKEAASQKRDWVKRGRSAKTFRYNPPEWHRDAVEALGQNAEETFKAIKLERIGLPPLSAATTAKSLHHATKKKSPAQLDREIAETLSGSREGAPSSCPQLEIRSMGPIEGAGYRWLEALPQNTVSSHSKWACQRVLRDDDDDVTVLARPKRKAPFGASRSDHIANAEPLAAGHLVTGGHDPTNIV